VALSREGLLFRSPSDLRGASVAFVYFIGKDVGGFFLLSFSLKLPPTCDLCSAQ
jgi:hypothetical protein